MQELVTWAQAGEILVVTIDNPPVNALSPGVPAAIGAAMDAAAADDAVTAVVVTGAGRSFIAGADIHEFVKITAGEKGRELGLQPVLERIENSPKPVVMAIHGSALGGGLEVAMSGHYRVAAAAAQVGQPEVKLGLIPGAGGTQRLPRLAGIAKALEMCVAGQPIGAAEAHAAGIVDEIVEGDLREGALAFARRIAGQPFRRTRDRDEKLHSPAEAAPLLDAARAKARQAFPGMQAPLAAVDAIEGALRLPFDEGLAAERRLFEECLFSDQSKALIHVFFGEREVAKAPGIGKDVAVLPLRSAALGEAGDQAKWVARGVARTGLVFAPTAADADLVIAFPEALADTERSCRPGALIAVLAHTFDVTGLAHPERVLGLHACGGRLVEVVRTPAASNEVIQTAMQLMKRFGRIPVLVRASLCARLAAVLDEQGGEFNGQALQRLAEESAKLLEEGMALRATDIDVAAVHGIGYPAYLGGPLWHATHSGNRVE
jgi:3-hydroxyacyl-CoA dehydrogenase